MNEKNKLRRPVITPLGNGMLVDKADNKYVVVITDPLAPYHKHARLTFYPDEITEMEDK